MNYTIAGNTIRQMTFIRSGSSCTKTVDAWFAYDDMNTEYFGEYTADPAALVLPDLRGSANQQDLHIAMSLDNHRHGRPAGVDGRSSSR